MVAKAESYVPEKGFKRKDQRYKQGNGEELGFIELLVKHANLEEMPHILESGRSMVIPCVDPKSGLMDYLQDAYDIEMRRSAKAGIKQKSDLSNLVRGIHPANSSCMTKIGRMIVAYGSILGVIAVKAKNGITFEETRGKFPTNDIADAKKWLLKFATNEAIFLVKNERLKLDMRLWVKGDGAEEVKGWTTEKELEEKEARMAWLLESPEELSRRARLGRMFNLSLSTDVQHHYVDGLYLVDDLMGRVATMQDEGSSSMTAEKMADAVLADLDACLMSHKCNDVFIEYGLYFAKIRLILAKIGALQDKQKLTPEFVWKHVKAEVLAAARVLDNRFSQIVDNTLRKKKFDTSFETDVFLRLLYDNCREDQVEAVKNRVKRDKQMRLLTANGGTKNEVLVATDLTKHSRRKCDRWMKTGKCSRGEGCYFDHPQRDLPKPNASTARPQDKKRRRDTDGGASGADTVKKVRAEVSKVRAETEPNNRARTFRGAICFHWEADGRCPYGNECRFSHESAPKQRAEVPEKKKPESARPAPGGKLPCFRWRDKGDCKIKDCKFSHEMVPCNVCTMRTHHTKDCPEVEGDEKGPDSEDEGDDSGDEIVAMMMRATCQDRRGSGNAKFRSKPFSIQRASVMFLREDENIGVQEVYTDEEVMRYVSTGMSMNASDIVVDLIGDGVDGCCSADVQMTADVQGVVNEHEMTERKQADAGDMNKGVGVVNGVVDMCDAKSGCADVVKSVAGVCDAKGGCASDHKVYCEDDEKNAPTNDERDGRSYALVVSMADHVRPTRVPANGADVRTSTSAWAGTIAGRVRPTTARVPARGADVRASAPVCASAKASISILASSETEEKDTRLHKPKGMGNGCFDSEVIQSGSGILHRNPEKDVVHAFPELRLPARNKEAFGVFVAAADAARVCGSGNDNLVRHNTYECLSVGGEVCGTYIYKRKNKFGGVGKLWSTDPERKRKPRGFVREPKKIKKGGGHKKVKKEGARGAEFPVFVPEPERKWKQKLCGGKVKNCAAVLVWGMMFLLACLYTVPFGLLSPFSKDLFPTVKNEFTVAEGKEVRPTQEWFDEMAGHRPFLKGVTRVKREKMFLATRWGTSLGTKWTSSVPPLVTVEECCAM